MSEAPERIWLSHAGSAREYDVPIQLAHKPIDYPGSVQEYIRADLPATDAQALANAKVRKMVEATKRLLECLDAQHSAGAQIRQSIATRSARINARAAIDAIEAQ